MASIVDEQNRLLMAERGEAEAVLEFIEELAEADADIAAGGRDVLRTSSWSCSGLYRRITQLDGTPTLEASDLAADLAERFDTRSRLELLCESQENDLHMVEQLLKRRDLDRTTRQFLKDLRNAHKEMSRWCRETLGEWRRDD